MDGSPATAIRCHDAAHHRLGRLVGIDRRPCPGTEGRDRHADGAHRRKLTEMLEFVKAFDGLADRFLGMSGPAMQMLARLMPSK